MPVKGECNAPTQDNCGSSVEASSRLSNKSATPLACAAEQMCCNCGSCDFRGRNNEFSTAPLADAVTLAESVELISAGHAKTCFE
jgi:hypothetical protein